MDLLNACKYAYRKHVLNDFDIGWDELSEILHAALCEAMGDNEYNKWLDDYYNENND